MLQSIIQFYQQEYLTIRDTFKRQKHFSLVLLLVQEIQFISLTIPTKNVRQNQTLSTLLNCFDYFKIYPIFGDRDNFTLQIIFDIILIISLSVMLLFLFLLYITKQSNIRTNDCTIITPIPLKLQHIEKKQLDSDLKQNITLYVSLYLQVGEFLFYQVFYFINMLVLKNSINNLSNNMNITGFIISLIFMPILVGFLVFQNAHKFDFGFKNADCLGSRMTYYVSIDFVFKYFIITLNIFLEIEWAILIILIAYFIWKLSVGHQQYIYQHSEIQQFSCIVQGQILIFIFLVLLFYGFGISQYELGYHFFFFFPLVLQVQRIQYNNYQSKVISMQNLTEDKLDIAIRYLYEQSHKVFVKEMDIINRTKQIKHYSLQIHTLIIRHLRECQEAGCFCFEFFPETLQTSAKSWQKYTDEEFTKVNEDSIGRFENQKVFKQFLIELLKHLYEKHLANNKIVSFSFWLSYIYFLSEIVKRPTLSFFEALNLNQKKRYKSTKNRMVIEALILRTRNTFNVMIVKMDLKNQKFDLQITFSFDESIQKIKENLILIIEKYKNWYGLLIFDKNNIAQILKKGQELKTAVDLAQNQLNAIFEANPLSQEIETLYQLYYKYINFFSKRNPNYKKSSKLTNNYLKSNQKEVFARDSFIIYISLLKPVGTILKYTNNFLKMSGHQETTQISNIRTYIPDMLAVHHDMYLMNFVQKGRMNIVKSEHRFLLIKNRNGFVVPVEAKIRLENYSTTEFGASALITKIITDNHHILLNKFGQLEEICEHLFTHFQKILKFELKQVKAIDFLMIVPQIWKLWKSKALIQEQDEEDDGLIHKNLNKEALLILPTKQREIQFLLINLATKRLSMKKYFEQSQIKLKRYFNNLDDCALFTIRFKITDIKTINQTAYIMEIQSMKQILRKEPPHVRIQRVKSMLETQFQEISDDQQIEYNLDHTMISEDNQMTEIVAQNIKITQQRVTLPTDRLTHTIQFTSDNQLQIPLRVLMNQPSSIVQEILKDSEDFKLNKSDGDKNESDDQEQVEGDKVDQNSVASFSGYQDQMTKRKLIRQILLDKSTSKIVRYFKVLLIANFLVTVSLSVALFITIINNLMATSIDMIIDHNVTRTEILFNNYIIFSYTEYFEKQEILEMIIKEFSQNSEEFQSIQSKYDLYTQIYSKLYQKNIEIFYEIVLINSLFMKALVTKQIRDLINIYSSFEVSLLELFSKLHENTANYNQQQVNILTSLFISAEIILGIFSISFMPIYYYFIQKNDHILSLTGRIGQQQIQKQNYLYESLIQLSMDKKFLTLEVGEGFLDTSKEKQSEIQSLNLQNHNRNIRSNKFTQRFRTQDQDSKGWAQYSYSILVISLFFALNSSYFLASYSLWKYQITQINNWVQQVDDTISYQLQLSNVLCQFVQFKYSQTNTIDYPISKEDYSQWIDWQIYFNQKSNEIIQINETAQINLCQYFDLQEIVDLQHYYYIGLNRTICEKYEETDKGVVIALTEILTQSHNLIEEQFNYNLYDDIVINGIFISAGLNLVYEYLFSFSITNLEQTFLVTQGMIFGIFLPALGILFSCVFTKISKSLNLQLINSKELLTLFPLDLILENSSIMAFIIEEAKENHNAN